jgi:two-component system phosphate regulon sensor histidine kinase PhoR
LGKARWIRKARAAIAVTKKKEGREGMAGGAHGGLAHRLRPVAVFVIGSGVVLTALVALGIIETVAAVAVFVSLAALAPLAAGRRGTDVLTRRHEDRQGDISFERALQLPLEAMDEPVFLLRGDGTIWFQNGAARTTFGAAEPGLHLSARIRSPAILGLVDEARAGDRAVTIEHAERVPSERWFAVRCAPVPDLPVADGERLFLLHFHDMSQARRMDRMRTDFVANASHELRTPLAALTGFIETLRGPARDDAAARERFLEIMYEQAMRMTRLVDDLMSLSRLELKAHLAPTDSVDMIALLNHVCDELRPQASDHDVVIETDFPAGPVAVSGDRDELIQVFENLVENACKYGEAGGRIIVSVSERAGGDGDVAEVAVRDFGPGIAPEHVPRLTERFYRVDVETSRAKNGTGLGLAIVKHILARHRSRLIVRSTLGEGSVFVVRLRRADERDRKK